MSHTIEQIVAQVIAELKKEGLEPDQHTSDEGTTRIDRDGDELIIDLADPTTEDPRHAMLVDHPYDADGLRNLMDTTAARLGVGRCGPRPKTQTMLLFQADHGVTQDAIYGVVPDEVKAQFDLFTVRSKAGDRAEFLLRPDLGRQLSDESIATIKKKMHAESRRSDLYCGWSFCCGDCE